MVKVWKKKLLADFNDHIIKWMVDYQEGELMIVGYNNGKEANQYVLKSQQKLNSMSIKSNKTSMAANNYDVVIVDLKLLDKEGTLLTDQDQKVEFEFEGDVALLGIDNGWEMNIQNHKTNQIVTHNGRAIAIFQAKIKAGKLTITAKSGDLKSNKLMLH